MGFPITYLAEGKMFRLGTTGDCMVGSVWVSILGQTDKLKNPDGLSPFWLLPRKCHRLDGRQTADASHGSGGRKSSR